MLAASFFLYLFLPLFYLSLTLFLPFICMRICSDVLEKHTGYFHLLRVRPEISYC
jgi:hypothetical protein